MTNVRVEQPAAIDPLQLEDLRRQREILTDQVEALGQLREKIEQAIQEAAERLQRLTD